MCRATRFGTVDISIASLRASARDAGSVAADEVRPSRDPHPKPVGLSVIDHLDEERGAMRRDDLRDHGCIGCRRRREAPFRDELVVRSPGRDPTERLEIRLA